MFYIQSYSFVFAVRHRYRPTNTRSTLRAYENRYCRRNARHRPRHQRALRRAFTHADGECRVSRGVARACPLPCRAPDCDLLRQGQQWRRRIRGGPASASGRARRFRLFCWPTAWICGAMRRRCLRSCPISPIVVHSSEDLNGEQVRLALPADLISDAILGTGFKPPVSGLYAEAIALLNASQVPVVAVDIPSGADADAMGPQQGIVARADSIITFTAPRPAHVFSSLTDRTHLRCRDRLAAGGDCFVPATQRDYCPRLCVADRATSGGLEQRQVWARAGGRRIARQSGLGGDGGDGGAASWGGLVHSGDSRICVAYGCRISSRTDDRAVGRNRAKARLRRLRSSGLKR